jgi:hypothetical protein
LRFVPAGVLWTWDYVLIVSLTIDVGALNTGKVALGHILFGGRELRLGITGNWKRLPLRKT